MAGRGPAPGPAAGKNAAPASHVARPRVYFRPLFGPAPPTPGAASPFGFDWIGRRSDMARFVLSRIGQTLAVLFTVSVIIFALMRMIPGDPVLMMLGDDFTQGAYEQLKSKLGLDRSVVVQYLYW